MAVETEMLPDIDRDATVLAVREMFDRARALYTARSFESGQMQRADAAWVGFVRAHDRLQQLIGNE
jgi:hypothetical protein